MKKESNQSRPDRESARPAVPVLLSPLGGGAPILPEARGTVPVATPVIPIDPGSPRPDPLDPRFALPFERPELIPQWQEKFHLCVADVPDGCYRLTFRPHRGFTTYNGTLRIDSSGGSTTVSGDLYRFSNLLSPVITGATPVASIASRFSETATAVLASPFAKRLGIPIYPRDRYHSYLKGTSLRTISFGSPGGACPVRITAEEFRYTQPPAGSFNGTFPAAPGTRTVVLSLLSAAAPWGYPGAYFTGSLLVGGVSQGTVELGWVSKHFRRCTIEVDTLAGAVAPQPVPALAGSKAAAQGLANEDFRTMLASAGWDARIEVDQTGIPAPAGVTPTACWSSANLHNLMASVRKATTNLDAEWRLHLVVVPATMGCSRGIMYDQIAVPREGVASFSNDGYPSGDSSNFGTAANQQQRNTPRAFLRSASHEIVHGFNQVHQEGEGGADNSIMTTTPSVADVLGGPASGAAGVFPDQIKLEVNDHVRHHMIHFPDVAVRPGGLTFGTGHGSQFIPQADRYAFTADELELTVSLEHDTISLGEPLMVSWTLTNNGTESVPVPNDISTQATYAHITVVDPRGRAKDMAPFVISCESSSIADLQPGESISAQERVFWSSKGFAFGAPGAHVLDVAIEWTAREIPCLVRASVALTVSTPMNAVDDRAAALLLHPQVGVYVALGGGADHLTEAVDRIAAVTDGGAADGGAAPAALRGFAGILPGRTVELDAPARERTTTRSGRR